MSTRPSPTRPTSRTGPIWLLFATLATGCGPSGEPEEQTSPPAGTEGEVTPEPAPATPLPPPAPGEGIQLRSARLTVMPGEDLTLCTYINGAISETSAVNGSMAIQDTFGHHISVYETDGYKPDGVAPCYDNDSGMVDGALVLGNFKKGYRTAYPEGIAVKIEPQNTLIVNSHYINTGEEPVEVQDAINLYFIPMETVTAFLGSYMLANFDINVPPGSAYQTTTSCPVPMDMNVLVLMGHEHEWGTRIAIDQHHKAGGVTTLYDGMPTVTDPTLAGMLFYYEQPLLLRAGDKIEWTCEWFNTTDHTLAWPDEMCTVVFTYYPEAPAQLTCARSVGELEE